MKTETFRIKSLQLCIRKMKNLLVFSCAVFLWSNASAEDAVQLLKNYDFGEGGYSILGTVEAESDYNGLADSLGSFYTDSIPVLNQFKSEWIFDKPGGHYACGYHYEVYICKNGVALENFSINLNCNEIVSKKGFFYFDPQKLRVFMGKVKMPFAKYYEFQSLPEARKSREKILEDSSLIMISTPVWVYFEGYFQFTYACKAKKNCSFENQKKEIETQIKKAYPDEPFELEDAGGSSEMIIVEIKCNKSLSDKFSLFEREYEYSGAWHPYSLTLEAYWRKRH